AMPEFRMPAAALGLIVVSLTDAFKKSAMLVLESKGSDALAWLDEFQTRTLDDVKNGDSQGLSYEQEVKLADATVLFLESIFDSVRTSFATAQSSKSSGKDIR